MSVVISNHGKIESDITGLFRTNEFGTFECGIVGMWEWGNMGVWECGNVGMWEDLLILKGKGFFGDFGIC